jgi:p-cumate 2,3-dioxygenase beta subunit
VTMAAAADRLARHALRLDVEEFLYEEAALLDAWRLDDWLALFTPDARYEVPSTDRPGGGPADALMLISDTRAMIAARVKRLNSRKAHREFPWSRTRRIIGNVRILCDNGVGLGGATPPDPLDKDQDQEIEVAANFAVYRSRRDVGVYMGRYRYRLVRDGDSFKIRFRRAELDVETLDAHGTLSIIL